MPAPSDLVDRFEPTAVEIFRYLGWDFDESTGELRLTYALDDLILTERVLMPAGEVMSGPRAQAFERIARLLWLAAGVSYYKAGAPAAVVVEGTALSSAEAAWAASLLVEGLGEFWYCNRLDPRTAPQPRTARWTLGPEWDYRTAAPRAALVGLGLADRPLIPVGGGKDSCVTIEALRDHAPPPLLGSVRRFPVIDAVMAASGLESVHVGRVIDPRLGELNARGAYNGHVPVTAIVSLALLATALRTGCDAVVMSNERSASEGNLTWAGIDVNHQWSKSADFERALGSLLATEVSPELRWFSLLRPYSELAITRRFANTGGRYREVFSSCNAAYRLDERLRVDRWDRDCPKCRFVALALAPFVTPAELVRVQGANLLDDDRQLPGFEALVGVGGPKPFECVGELAESRVAVRLLSEDPAWRDAAVVAALADRLTGDAWPSDDDVAGVFAADPAWLVPTDYQAATDAFAAPGR